MSFMVRVSDSISVENQAIKLRLNNFPEEILYTVIDSQTKTELFHTNDFCDNWKRPETDNTLIKD